MIRLPFAIFVVLSAFTGAFAADVKPISPTKTVALFNGKNLDGFTTWLKSTGGQDPKHVFSVQDGMIRVSGVGAGYLATKHAYRDYHLSLEYKWGTKTDGSKFVRNSGVLLHATGPDGGARGVWMTSIECQLAQGCEGDLIVIRGKDASGKTIPATISSRVRIAEDKKTRWDPKGKPRKYSGRQFWWSKHQLFFKELRDTRGKDDVASPLGKWTKVECICRGDRLTIRINGKTVNGAFAVSPSAGKILLQNEGNEIFFRNVSIGPAGKSGDKP